MVVCPTSLHSHVFGVHIVGSEVVKGTEGLGRAAYSYITLIQNGQYPKGTICVALIVQAF